MKVFKCLQICFIYIGSIIGAGFATGREIMLYFGGNGILSGIVAGVAMGVLCGLFLWSAKSFARLRSSRNGFLRVLCVIVKVALWVCTLASFVCMVSGCEEIIEKTYGIANVGLWTGILVSFLGICEMSVTRKLNTVIVPIIVLLLIVLFCQGERVVDTQFDAKSVLGYCGMNIMMGGYIIAEQEESFSAKQTIFISAVSGIIFAICIAMVYTVSIRYADASMPIWEFAKARGMSSLSGLIIYLAIFSTLIGCAKLICQENFSIKIPRIFSVAFLIIFALISLKFDFSTIVNFCYPIIGYVGIVYTCFMLVLPIATRIIIYKSSGRCDCAQSVSVREDSNNSMMHIKRKKVKSKNV
ncbi:MAG: hypothetical protein K2L70_04785 [Clostridia bacterium]|nr:hypothetical protein [Clostridia bacterium]